MERYMNPFDMLDATPRDTRLQLASKAQTAALLKDAAQAEAARMALTRPETRLEAEIRWISKDGGEERKPLDDLNRAVEEMRGAKCVESQKLQELLGLFAAADLHTILSILNADRREAGFREADDEAVKKSRREYAREIALCLMDTAKTMQTKQLASVLSRVCGECRKQGTLIGNALLEETLDAYELHIAPEASPIEDALMAFVDSMLAPEAPPWLKKEYRKKKGHVDGIAQQVRTWTMLMEPMCIYEDARGMFHQHSFRMLDKLEDAYIEMVNRHRCYLPAYTLIKAMQEGFSEISQQTEWLKNERDRMKMCSSPQYRKAQQPKEPWQMSLLKLGALLLVMAMVRGCMPDEKPSRSNTPDPPYRMSYDILQEEIRRAEELMKATSYLRILNLKEDIEELEANKAETLARYEESQSPYDLVLYQKLESEIDKKQKILNLEYEKYGKEDPLALPGLSY